MTQFSRLLFSFQMEVLKTAQEFCCQNLKKLTLSVDYIWLFENFLSAMNQVTKRMSQEELHAKLDWAFWSTITASTEGSAKYQLHHRHKLP